MNSDEIITINKKTFIMLLLKYISMFPSSMLTGPAIINLLEESIVNED